MSFLRRWPQLAALFVMLALTALFAPWAAAQAAPKRVLFFTRSDGFRHDSIAVASTVLRTLAPAEFAVTHSEDIGLINAERLREFDAIFFFTSGELPLSAQQRLDLLAYLRNGGGFGGAHSATDTLYGWPEYGEMIGGIFDGHPWVQEAELQVEDPQHPATAALPQQFRMLEEFYQFRAFSRDRTRVLLTLDANSVNLQMPGVNRTDRDFALAWAHRFGQGRIFYTALGHFDGTWRDSRFQAMLLGAMRWLTGGREGEATPRGGAGAAAPRVVAVAEAAQGGFRDRFAPGTILSLYGENLTSGSQMAADGRTRRLAGTRVLLGEEELPLYFAGPNQVNVVVPAGRERAAELGLRVIAGVREGSALPVRGQATMPGIFAVTRSGDAATIWCTGFSSGVAVSVQVNGQAATVLFAGPSPEFPGLAQVNVRWPAGTAVESVLLQAGGEQAQFPPRR